MTGSVLHNSNSLSDTVMEEVGMAEDEVDGFLDEAIAAEQREVKKLDERLAVLKEQCHQLECITANLEAIGESYVYFETLNITSLNLTKTCIKKLPKKVG